MATAHLAWNENFSAFAANATEWFVTDIASVLSACPLAGCGASPITVYADDREVWSMALNSTGVYWTNGIGDVLSCPLAGCGGAPPALVAHSDGKPNLLAVDDGHVYWLEPGTTVGGGKIGPIEQWLDGGVYESALDAGADAAPTPLASYPSWLGGAAIAVDGTDVYWSTEDGSGRFGQIVRCSIGGCCGSPTPIAGTAPAPYKTASTGLAVDSTRVYWSDSAVVAR